MKILIIDAALPARDASAGERATFDVMDACRALGHEVTLAALGLTGDEPRREAALREAGIPVLNGIGGIDSGTWDVIVVNRPGPALASLNQVLTTDAATVFWGHDIHTWRLQAQQDRQADVPGHQLLLAQVAERRCWDGYDLSVYPTDREAAFINDEGLGRAVAVPYYRLTGEDLAAASAPTGRRGCLMVGGSFHSPNADAVEFAAREVLPLLAEDASLTVVGEWPERARIEGVTFTGRVSEQRLRELHDEHLCLLAPLRFGAGARRKLVAAMGLGLPVVTTPEGVRGLLVRDATPADGALVGADAVELAALVRRLRDEPQTWNASAATALQAVTDVYSAPRFDAAVADIMQRVTQS